MSHILFAAQALACIERMICSFLSVTGHALPLLSISDFYLVMWVFVQWAYYVRESV